MADPKGISEARRAVLADPTLTAVLKNGTRSTEMAGKMVGDELRLSGGGRELVGRVNGSQVSLPSGWT